MPLVVEDGTGVSGADSYISLANARFYLDKRNRSLNVDDIEAEKQLRVAFDFVDNIHYIGEPLVFNQAAAWPRKHVYLNGTPLNTDVVPTVVGFAQAHLAAAIEEGVEIFPVQQICRKVASEEVGPIKTEFFESGSEKMGASVPQVKLLLRPYLAFGAIGLTTARA